MTVLSPNVVRRLTLARYQLTRARLQLVGPTEFSAWQAAIALHDAAEIAVLAIADASGVVREKRSFLHELPKAIEKRTGKAFHDRTLIETDLSEVRNPAKHRGGFPGVSDVVALSSRTHECLELNCELYLQQPLSGFSLADMVIDADVRELIKEAEGKIEDGDYASALAALKHAWKEIVDLAVARKPLEPLAFGHRLPIERLPREIREFARDLEGWREGVESKLKLLMLGVDPLRHAAFEAIGPKTQITGGGQRLVYLDVDAPIVYTRANADFCLAFLLDTVVRFQEIERVRQPRSRYVIRTKAGCAFYFSRVGYEKAGDLPANTQIEDAELGLGLAEWPAEERAWFWTDAEAKSTYFIRMSDAEIESSIPYMEYVRKETVKRRAAPPVKPAAEDGSES